MGEHRLHAACRGEGSRTDVGFTEQVTWQAGNLCDGDTTFLLDLIAHLQSSYHLEDKLAGWELSSHVRNRIEGGVQDRCLPSVASESIHRHEGRYIRRTGQTAFVEHLVRRLRTGNCE